jgi:GH35 family endo-1,4-beta-xylanase
VLSQSIPHQNANIGPDKVVRKLALHRRNSRLIAKLSRRIALVTVSSLIAFQVGASSEPLVDPLSAATLRQAAEAHHILIGAAVTSRYLAESEYSNVLGSEFSQLQAENEMKFSVIHPRADSDPQPYDFRGGDALVAFAQAHNMVVRGHALVWHKQVPEWITKGTYSSPELARILGDHITTVMGHYASKVYAWDVVNEAFNDDGSMRHTIWYDEPGIGVGSGYRYIEQVLRWAHVADPNAKLFYNDYDVEEVNRKSDAIYAMAKDFKKRGVPLDGIGFQTHISLKFDDRAIVCKESTPFCRARSGASYHGNGCPPQRRKSSLAGSASQALWRDHQSVRATTQLQAPADLGIHRQALLDSKFLQGKRVGAAVG